MTVTQLLRNTTARELVEWVHYLKISKEKPKESPEQIAEKMRQTFGQKQFKRKKK